MARGYEFDGSRRTRKSVGRIDTSRVLICNGDDHQKYRRRWIDRKMRPGIRRLEAELRVGLYPVSIVTSYKPRCSPPDVRRFFK